MMCADYPKCKNKQNSLNLFKNRKGIAESPTSGSGAAVLVLLITILIVVYILFLPPADRAKLLDGEIIGNPGGTDSHTSMLGTNILNEKPGKITYIKDDIIEHDLASFRIYTQTDAQKITELSKMEIKNSAFDKNFKELKFNINKDLTDNLYLAFNVNKFPSGNLRIYLNTILIYDGFTQEGSISPIKLSKGDLKNENILYFKVSSPGFAFWRVNQYKLSNIVVTGDVTDREHSFHMQNVYISPNEFDNLKTATLEFFPDCNPREVDKLSIRINSLDVYYGLPDCNMINKVNIPKNIIVAEENKLEFISDLGSYIIDTVKVKTKLNEPEYPIYYFDLSEDLFTQDSNSETYCGKVDGICSNGCREYEDKDCCFAESRNNLWCDVKTTNPYDRCVSVVLDETISRCASGYEDRIGEPAEVMENDRVCGDDTDNYCPSGCSKFYDKDCCYDDDDDNYWCNDIPQTGMDSVCTKFVTQSECDACPSNYLDADNKKPNCDSTSSNDDDGEEILKSDVDVVLKVDFTSEDYKKVDFIINGMKIPVDTYYLRYSRVIDEQIRSGTNSIQIKPRSDVTIAQMKIVIK
jgi:hypothetical protein